MRKAYLAVATTGFTSTPLSSPVTIDGQPVPLDNLTLSGIDSYNYFTDVTGLVKSKLDAASSGSVSFTVVEPEPNLTDGEILVVIYDDPAVTVDQTVSILFGALKPTGDQYSLSLATPIELSDPGTHLEMSLGISYSCQSAAFCSAAGQQFSITDVNGTRLTTAAGGEDDGQSHNGALLTVGGEGDSLDNPVDPNATPTNPRSDDELYDLRPFVHDGETRITVQTSNPSLDDNVFLATFTMNPPVTSIGTGLPGPGDVICSSRPSGPGDGWAYTAQVTATQGLAVKDVRFGPRYVARMISVPYIKLVGLGDDSSGFFTVGHLTVTPAGDSDLQTRLLSVACQADPPTNQLAGVSATYEVTGLSTGLTFLVQQSYRFDPFDTRERCEATETAPCVRFWPTVTWALKGEAPRPDIGLEIVQRFEFDPDAVGHGAADVIADTLTANNVGADNLSSDGYLKREDIIGPRVDGGPMLNHGPALDHGQTGYWENWHQTGRDRVGLPSPLSAGCTECVHAHWSWFHNLNLGKLAVANTLSCGSRNCWTDGKPEILEGSQQTVYAGWVKWRDGEQQPDPADWRSLIDPKDQDASKVDPAKDRLVFYWDARTTASGSPPNRVVTIDGTRYDVGDSYWPQLDNKRHGGNGSMFFVPARRFITVNGTPGCVMEANIAPDYEVAKRYYDGAAGSPRLPAGYVLPVKLTLGERPSLCSLYGVNAPRNYRDQGPYYLRVKSTGPRVLNADPLDSPEFGGARWVRVYPDTLTPGPWSLSKEPQDPQLLKYSYQQGYMLALLVFDRPPTAADTSFELDAAPNGVATYEAATGDW